jgi:hypothetical protein
MSDEVKGWLAICGVLALLIVSGSVVIHNYNQYQSELRRAACVNPDSVACALAVRQ